MEFLLVPLAAITAVAFVIDKLAKLAFHIHLSWRLLILLGGFAWLISMVLPRVFFHSAGLVGSVTLSLLCAAGFAWLAAIYDVRTGASRSIPAGNLSVPVTEMGTGETYQVETELPPEPFLPAPQELMQETVLLPVLTTEIERQIDFGEFDGIKRSEEQPAKETVAITTAPSHGPDSTSLEDLLEVAFEQRSLRQDAQAVETFRLIKRRFRDSEALPMVVAEIVSTLQSQGNLTEAAVELKEILQMPEIRKQEQLIAVFERKLTDILLESGKKTD